MSKSLTLSKDSNNLEQERYEPLKDELKEILTDEYQEAKKHQFPEYHPYAEAIKRAIDSNIMTFLAEKVIARHCFHVCAEIIREEGAKGREKPTYQHYLFLLKLLPTDWFDDQKGKLLDDIDVLN